MSHDDPGQRKTLPVRTTTRRRARKLKTSEAEAPQPVEPDPPAPEPRPKTPADRLRIASNWARDWAHDNAKRGWHHVSLIPAPIRWTVGIVLVLLIAVILFLANPNWDWFRPTLKSLIAGRTHRPVQINGHLRVHLFSFTPSAKVEGLKVGAPSWAPKTDVADIQQLFVRAELMPLFTGRIVLPRLEVTRPVVFLYQDKTGRANWDFSDGTDKGKPTKLPLIKNFIITDGRVTLTSLQRKMTFKGTVNAHEKAGAGREAFALTGDGSLNGKVFELSATGGPLLNVKSTVPYPFDMKVRAGETRITARGRVLHPFDLGQLDAAMTLSGNSLDDLYYLTGLALPNTPPFRLAANVTRNERLYTIERINGRVGGSDLEGKATVETRSTGRPYLTGDLSSRVLDFKDMGSLFGATRANAPTAAKMVADPQATRGRRLLPDVPLDVDRVRNMDAKVRYRALSVRTLANMPLRQVSLGIQLDHGLMTLDPVELSFPQGRLAGTAKIDARNATQTNAVDMRLTGLRVQDFVPGGGKAPPLEGILDARVQASGSGNTVHKAAASADGRLTLVIPGGQIRQSLAELMGIDASKGLFLLLAKDKHQTDIRCAIADFKVTNGVMQAQHIVFDTGVVVVNGSGTVNLNDESLKLIFKGKPKKFRLIRVNAPIKVGGHLTAPTFGIDAKPAIVQGGLALAFNSIIPFIGLDTAKDANCAGLMSEARAKGAPTTTRTAAKPANPSPMTK